MWVKGGPHIVKPIPGSRAKRIVARDERVISPSYTRTEPIVAKERARAGAEIIVTGTLVEQAKDRVKKIREMVKAIKSARGDRRIPST
ncbi:unnamed protein product [marine sediment metagenome]|uniref:Uncharacterized protein n=1 Tax=marine sediment metagenome TaxID=412755 RepID=X1PXE0_9ZZZZ